MVKTDRLTFWVALVLWVALMLLLLVSDSRGQTRVSGIARNVPVTERFGMGLRKALQKRVHDLGLDIEVGPLDPKTGRRTVKGDSEYIELLDSLVNFEWYFPPSTPEAIDRQFQRAYQAARKTKPWIVTTSIPAMIDVYFQRAYRDFGKTKPFIVTSNVPDDLDRYFDKLYMAVNGGM